MVVMPRWGFEGTRYCEPCGVQDARVLNNPAQAKRSVGCGDVLLYMRASGTRPLTEPDIVRGNYYIYHPSACGGAPTNNLITRL